MTDSSVGRRSRRTAQQTRSTHLDDLRLALRPNDILVALQAIDIDATDLAEGIGADERTVRRWLDGQPPNRKHEQTIGALRVLVIHILQRHGLRADLVAHWLRLPDENLACETPLATVAEGRLADAVGAFDAYIAPRPGGTDVPLAKPDVDPTRTAGYGDREDADHAESNSEVSAVPVG